jgi:hypothetical protein
LKSVISVATSIPSPNQPDNLKQQFNTVNEIIVKWVEDYRINHQDEVLFIDQAHIVAGYGEDEISLSVDDVDYQGYNSMIGTWLNDVNHAAINID